MNKMTVRTLAPHNDVVAQSDLIHITLIAEAYTSSQKEEFFGYVAKVVNESFFAPGSAFESLLPLLAVHAIHVPSGTGSIPNEYETRGGANNIGLRGIKAASSTFFGLRREDGPLRTVAPPGSGKREYARAKQVCADSVLAVRERSKAVSAASPKHAKPTFVVDTVGAGASSMGCDHVLLVAHDPWYGGLGDEVAIFTSSDKSGGLALRHELGHILADIGEEYDGGGDYSGPNFSETARRCEQGEGPRKVRTSDGVREVWPCISWGDWIDDGDGDGDDGSGSGSRSRRRRDGTSGVSKTVPSPLRSMLLAEWPFVPLRPPKAGVGASDTGDTGASWDLAGAQSGMPGTRVLLSIAGVGRDEKGDSWSRSSVGITSDTGQRCQVEVTVSGLFNSTGKNKNGPPTATFATTLRLEAGFDRQFHTIALPSPFSLLPTTTTTPPQPRRSPPSPQKLTVTLVPVLEMDGTASPPPWRSISPPVSSSSASSSSATPPPPMVCHLQVHQFESLQAAEKAAKPEAAAAAFRPQPLPSLTRNKKEVLSGGALRNGGKALRRGRDRIGAFPVFGRAEKKGQPGFQVKGYRPTDEGCLMRRMAAPCFCSVCLERLWRRVLPRAGLLRAYQQTQMQTPPALQPRRRGSGRGGGSGGEAKVVDDAEVGGRRVSVEWWQRDTASTTAASSSSGGVAVSERPVAAAAAAAAAGDDVVMVTLSVRPAPLGSAAGPPLAATASTATGTPSRWREEESLELHWSQAIVTLKKKIEEKEERRQGQAGTRKSTAANRKEEDYMYSAHESAPVGAWRNRRSVHVSLAPPPSSAQPSLSATASSSSPPPPPLYSHACWLCRAQLSTQRIRREPKVFEEAAFVFLLRSASKANTHAATAAASASSSSPPPPPLSPSLGVPSGTSGTSGGPRLHSLSSLHELPSLLAALFHDAEGGADKGRKDRRPQALSSSPPLSPSLSLLPGGTREEITALVEACAAAATRVPAWETANTTTTGAEEANGAQKGGRSFRWLASSAARVASSHGGKEEVGLDTPTQKGGLPPRSVLGLINGGQPSASPLLRQELLPTQDKSSWPHPLSRSKEHVESSWYPSHNQQAASNYTLSVLSSDSAKFLLLLSLAIAVLVLLPKRQKRRVL